MKIKKPIKQTPLRENPPMPVTATSQGEALPPGAEYFSKLRTLSPRDFITQLCAPKLKSATDEEAKLVIECFAGIGLLRIDGRRIGSTMNQPDHDTTIRQDPS